MSWDEEDPVVIQLGDGLITWISPIDSDLANLPWHAKEAGREGLKYYYAEYQEGNSRKYRVRYSLHTMVWERMMEAPLPPGFLVDHINGDKLDNRRSNLRLATRSDNEANKRKRRSHKKKDGSIQTYSKYKGVTKIQDGRKKCWRAIISTNTNNAGKTKQVNLGTFYTEREAAEAYNKAALEMFGEFALLNDFDDEE